MATRSDISNHFILTDEQFEANGTYYDWPKVATSRRSVNSVKNLLGFDDILKPEHRILGDLIRKCLIIDPNNRISCADALKHEFFKTNFDWRQYKINNMQTTSISNESVQKKRLKHKIYNFWYFLFTHNYNYIYLYTFLIHISIKSFLL